MRRRRDGSVRRETRERSIFSVSCQINESIESFRAVRLAGVAGVRRRSIRSFSESAVPARVDPPRDGGRRTERNEIPRTSLRACSSVRSLADPVDPWSVRLRPDGATSSLFGARHAPTHARRRARRAGGPRVGRSVHQSVPTNDGRNTQKRPACVTCVRACVKEFFDQDDGCTHARTHRATHSRTHADGGSFSELNERFGLSAGRAACVRRIRTDERTNEIFTTNSNEY